MTEAEENSIQKSLIKRNAKQNKILKKMIADLDCMFGPQGTGMFLSMILDALYKMMKEETPSEYINLRTVEIKFNDFYSVKLNCDTGEYI